MELFGGVCGLALGLEQANFRHALIVERDSQAIATLRANAHTRDWPVLAEDVLKVDLEQEIDGPVELLAAGVPCQPFSQAGVHAGPEDERNMFPATFSALRILQPKAVLIENVRGLARPAFRPFLDYIADHLRLPYLKPLRGESWPEHHRRLRAALQVEAGTAHERYVVEWRSVNVADYGVGQRRVRVMIVAIRADLASEWHWPEPTHSHTALLRDQLDGYYWFERDLAPRCPVLKRETRRRVARLKRPVELQPWRTLRDVLDGLPPAVKRGLAPSVDWHVLWPGARLYRGHRGSELDAPSKTIKAGVHGVAGGEHIVHLDDGSFRYLTVRECARAQDLPDWLEFPHPRTVATRQIGNAVPPTLGRVFGLAIARCLCQAQTVPKAASVREQDEAAGGYLNRQVMIGRQRVTASVRLQKDYAYLYWTRSAGKPRYLGKVVGKTRAQRLRAAWDLAHREHPELFISNLERAA